MKDTTDFLIIGGGIIGINLALRAKEACPDQRVVLIEKETACGQHASGRNSGVLHAGFYYTADSLKARFTRDGNAALTAYCEEKGLPIYRCGKLVVARNEQEFAGLAELSRRAQHNGVELYEIDEHQAREIEPTVRPYERALFSPTTSSIDPGRIVEALLEDARNAGIEIRERTGYLKHDGMTVTTSSGEIEAGYVVNAAGLYADQIAKDYGFSEAYEIIPFKGLYLYLQGLTTPVRTHVYPVPDLANPFLGVHCTVAVDGAVKLGPTAIPALWREHYRGIENFRLAEFAQIIWRESGLFLRNDFNFRQLAYQELPKYSKSRLIKMAGELAELQPRRATWGKPGVRAQLYDVKERRLEMDFRFEADERSFHVLNAVSPAFTCSIPFSEYLWQEMAASRAHHQ